MPTRRYRTRTATASAITELTSPWTMVEPVRSGGQPRMNGWGSSTSRACGWKLSMADSPANRSTTTAQSTSSWPAAKRSTSPSRQLRGTFPELPHGMVSQSHCQDSPMPIARSTRITPQEILHHWGIRLDAPLEPMPALTNAVARSGPYVVRSEQRSRDSVRWEHDLLRFLAAGVPEVIAPLRARDGSSLLVRDDEIVSVFPYVEGDHIDRTEERVRAQLPPVLGRIHRRASAWTPA